MSDPLLTDQRIDQRGIDPAQADMGPGSRRDRPGIGPAIAVEHRQGPEVDRLRRQTESHKVPESVQVGPSMVIDHPFRIAGRAGGVVERERLPFVLKPVAFEGGITLRQQGVVVE